MGKVKKNGTKAKKAVSVGDAKRLAGIKNQMAIIIASTAVTQKRTIEQILIPLFENFDIKEKVDAPDEDVQTMDEVTPETMRDFLLKCTHNEYLDMEKSLGKKGGERKKREVKVVEDAKRCKAKTQAGTRCGRPKTTKEREDMDLCNIHNNQLDKGKEVIMWDPDVDAHTSPDGTSSDESVKKKVKKTSVKKVMVKEDMDSGGETTDDEAMHGSDNRCMYVHTRGKKAKTIGKDGRCMEDAYNHGDYCKAHGKLMEKKSKTKKMEKAEVKKVKGAKKVEEVKKVQQVVDSSDDESSDDESVSDFEQDLEATFTKTPKGKKKVTDNKHIRNLDAELEKEVEESDDEDDEGEDPMEGLEKILYEGKTYWMDEDKDVYEQDDDGNPVMWGKIKNGKPVPIDDDDMED